MFFSHLCPDCLLELRDRGICAICLLEDICETYIEAGCVPILIDDYFKKDELELKDPDMPDPQVLRYLEDKGFIKSLDILSAEAGFYNMVAMKPSGTLVTDNSYSRDVKYMCFNYSKHLLHAN
jgi:hypothetical protein